MCVDKEETRMIFPLSMSVGSLKRMRCEVRSGGKWMGLNVMDE